ncbi:MAG TPA: serine/threonine-protein kinase, partial [Candidatus Melainabacteria bacterium]|nr:serine/threonine-protein kinase [Candidatus Melainabacteria bacterium]
MQADDSSDKEKRRPLVDDGGTVPSLLSLELASQADSSLDMEMSAERIERSLIGQIIDDKFRITDILGKGGMSVVYKAHWVVLNKVVAVKTMHAHLASDTNALMRFKQEAQATIALEHPNVVKVYQFGITGGEDSKPYIVMDYLEGESLSERIKAHGRVPVKEALQIFSQVCNALEHAHQKGVIHRDLKPSNIMLLHKEGEPPQVKIVDFG